MFSIADDELDIDFDDEDFLLEACGISLPKNPSTLTTNAPSMNTINPSYQNKPLQPSVSENRKSSSSRTSYINTNLNKTSPKFNSKVENNHERDSGPPLKKIASNCVRNKSPLSGQGSVSLCGSLKENRTTRNHYPSSPSTNNTFSNCKTNGLRNNSNSPSTSGISKDHNGITRSGVSSPHFQTPDQTCQKQIRNLNSGANPSNACDLSELISVTPSRKKSARKFPGPAGLLPKLSSGQSLDELPTKMSPLPPTTKSSPNSLQSPVSSQSQTPSEDEEFSRDPWMGMFKEYKENVPATMRYSIVQVISEAACQHLKHGKVPSLCVLVKTSLPTETDASIFLKDPTGEIHGTLHKKVLEEYQSELGPGAGLILKQVSVFSPSPRKHYLNITPGNIIHIYPPNPNHVSCSQPLSSQGTQSLKANSQERITIAEPEIVLETQPSELQKDQENSPEDLDNFNDLLEGLDDEDDILDEDLLAMY